MVSAFNELIVSMASENEIFMIGCPSVSIFPSLLLCVMCVIYSDDIQMII